MSELIHLQPAEVFKYFDDICSIPHGSGNTKAISDYCVSFAEKHGLRYIQDKSENVIIFKEASSGYEDHPAVIIQGHLDMVCEKERDCTIDMDCEGLIPYVDGEFVKAKGTTLGGDDGIAIAYALAILASDSIEHPPIEAVFTTSEEVGMEGAASLDASPLKGRLLLNIDSEEEGCFLVSCAGGIRVDCVTPLKQTVDEKVRFDVRIHGLSGGHSGVEINRYGANSNILAGRLLQAIETQAELYINDIHGGLKDNAIPVETEIRFYTNEEDCDSVKETITRICSELRSEYAETDPDLDIFVKQGPSEISKMFDAPSTNTIIFQLMNYPNGVQRMSAAIPGLVETSLNLGILYIKDQELHCSFSIRSSVSSAKEALVDKLVYMTEHCGGTCRFHGDYPAWEYKKDSPLRDAVSRVYRNLYQKDCQFQAIHAGLECGLFSGKLPGLDCVSFGPNLYDIHTPRERMEIASVARVWDFLLELLKEIK